jgi:hypothetical protein
VTFRDRLLQSLARVQPVLEIPGVLVGGSQVPNLLEPDAASTLVVSQDVDLVIPVAVHAQVRDALAHVTERSGLKGERDLLVALGLLMHCGKTDVVEVTELFGQLRADARATLLANLAVLSLMRPLPAMPDPVRGRNLVEALLARLREIA